MKVKRNSEREADHRMVVVHQQMGMAAALLKLYSSSPFLVWLSLFSEACTCSGAEDPKAYVRRYRGEASVVVAATMMMIHHHLTILILAAMAQERSLRLDRQLPQERVLRGHNHSSKGGGLASGPVRRLEQLQDISPATEETHEGSPRQLNNLHHVVSLEVATVEVAGGLHSHPRAPHRHQAIRPVVTNRPALEARRVVDV